MEQIIADEEFDRGVVRVMDMSAELQNILVTYSNEIQKLTQEGIQAVAIDNALMKKLEFLNIQVLLLVEVTKQIKTNTKQFIDNIERADSSNRFIRCFMK